ncbi:arginine deiminase [Sedimentibacter sp. zth1]|uniref:arginine deiminase n=1 Tax=Sedimentibacter sp. zth1 TaxID=2816908 RepID=UPI001A919C07|nr:arginine deiminase [Sedimentibacter sp. zth1]QSX05323.1 arginine deiminase [Sedimentibacter sp. zth1]
MNNDAIQIYSEIGKLKKVLLHRPGYELENLMPDYLERLLFDDIPYLKVAQEEHDAFADILRKNGSEVVYLEDLVTEAITDNDVKNNFISEYIIEAGIKETRKTEVLTDFFKSYENKDMVMKMIAGVRKSEIKGYEKRNLVDFLDDDYPFLIDPMPNLYFTRDNFSTVGRGVSLHKMHTVTRGRETLFGKYVFKYHKEYNKTPLWYDRTEDFSVEGGDVLILNEDTVAIGISQRTQPSAIEKYAKNLLGNDSFNKILAIDIPKHRAFMHLDTVFTMVDYDKFTIHPNIKKNMNLFAITKKDNGELSIEEEHGSVDEILKRHLNLDKVSLITCGGGNVIDAAREQWNDGSNTLAISPGNVVVYARNYVSNKVLEESGIKVHVMPSAELSRGRGGPRCMSMPLVREPLKK